MPEPTGTTLITGATGRVGRALARHLAQRGTPIRALVLPDDPGHQRLAAEGVDVRVGRLEDLDDVRGAVAGVAGIVHLASKMSWDPADEAAIFDGNVRGTYNLLQAATEAMPTIESVIFASSDDTYPSLLGRGELLAETRPQAPMNPYALSKEIGERISLFRWRTAGLPVGIVRFSVVAAAGEALGATGWLGRFLFSGGWIDHFREGGDEAAAESISAAVDGERDVPVVLRGEHGDPYVLHIADVRDICAGLTLMLDQPEKAAGEVFNLSGPAPFTLEEAAAALREHAGLVPRDITLPGEPVAIRLDIGKARSVLGYDPQWSIARIVEEAASRRQLASAKG